LPSDFCACSIALISQNENEANVIMVQIAGSGAHHRLDSD
jgi:hypothetical protein